MPDPTPAAPPAQPPAAQPPAAAPPPPARPPPQVVRIEHAAPAGAPPNGDQRYVSAERLAKLTQADKDRQVAEAATAAAQTALAAAQAEAKALQRRYTTDTTMLAMAVEHPDFAHAEIRDFFSEQHDKYAGRTGEGAKSFAEWMAEQKATPSPLLRPYFAAAPGPGAPPNGAPPLPPLPALPPKGRPVVKPPLDVDVGANPPPQVRSRYTPEQVIEVAGNPHSEQARQAWAQLVADGAAVGELPGPRKRR